MEMITPEEVASVPIFAALPEALRERIVSRSADIRVSPGEWITTEGATPYFWTVLTGEVEVVKRHALQTHQLTTFDPGEYFGEIPLMLGSESNIDARALRPSRLMRTDEPDFHLMVSASPEASAMLTQSLVRRVNFRREAYVAATLTECAVVGDRYDFACHDLRDFLSRNHIAYEWLDPADPGDAAVMPAAVRDARSFPVIILADGRRLETPSLRELAEALSLQTVPGTDSYDLAILGGGPAGLAAAVYGGSEGLKTIMIEREAPGGQAGTSSRIENYLGFPTGVSGDDLASRALFQAKRFGTEILVTRSVGGLRRDGADHVVELDGQDEVRTRALLIATGVRWRRLEADGAERLVGRGIYYGAARTEALGVRGKDVYLVGGGNSAGQAAMFFSSYARSVTILVRGPALAASMSAYLIKQLELRDNVTVETETSVAAVQGETHLEAIVTKVNPGGPVRVRPADALFVFIGADAETDWIPEAIERDRRGYLLTDRDVTGWPLERTPFPLETSVPGIFAAGDVRSGSVKRVASSVGEGSMAIAFVHQYLSTLAPA